MVSLVSTRSLRVLVLFAAVFVVLCFFRSRQLRPITLYQKISKMNSSAKITPLDIYCNCPAERLQLCQSECQTKLQVIDAELRLCRSEKELFLAAGDEDVGERCLSFKDLAAMPHNRWARVRLPEAYWTYPMDVDLNKVVSVYSYGLKMNVSPVNNPSLSVIHSSNLVCTAGNTNSYATMIIVKSAITNYAQRLRLRQLIRKQTAQINVTVAILFSLGLPSNGKVPPELVQEITQFDDILLANYTDTYMNLTLKTITNLRFVHRHCLHTSPSFVFLDDDHGINLTQLHEFFSKLSLSEVRRSIFGFINSKSPVLRTRKSKWFTEPEAFPFPKYPDYAAGPCYIIGAELIPKFSIAAAFTQFFPVEDVFLGIITAKFGLRVHPLPNVYLHQSKLPPSVFPMVAGLDFFGRKLNI